MQLIQHTLLIVLTQETILHFNNQEHFSKLYITISAFKPLQLLFTLILHRHGIANVRSDESSISTNIHNERIKAECIPSYISENGV